MWELSMRRAVPLGWCLGILAPTAVLYVCITWVLYKGDVYVSVMRMSAKPRRSYCTG